MEVQDMPDLEIGLTEKDRLSQSRILNKLLADEFTLYVQTRNFHWNVTGMNFAALHGLFEKQYEELDETVDAVAERVRALGHFPIASVKEFLDEARIRETPGGFRCEREMLAALLESHEAVVRTLRQSLQACERCGDAGTADFLTGLMARHEKAAWMLRSHLQEQPNGEPRG